MAYITHTIRTHAPSVQRVVFETGPLSVWFYHAPTEQGVPAMLVRTRVAVRHQMLKMTVQMSNQIRGLMKTFELVVPKSAGSVLEGHIRTLLATNAGLERIVLPMLEAWLALRALRS